MRIRLDKSDFWTHVRFTFFSIVAYLSFVVYSQDSLAESAHEKTFSAQNGEVHLFVESSSRFELPMNAIEHWVETAIQALTNYYGRMPVEDIYVTVQHRNGRGVLGGKALGVGVAAVNIMLGEHTRKQDLQEDWILLHELIHMAFPRMPGRYEWIEEGLATYIEAIARAAINERSEENLWAYFYENMPHGLPQSNDRGLDNTRTWGRVYWGGALFCLLADIEIRQQTNNKKSLRDALVALLEKDLNHLQERNKLDPLLKMGDQATGTSVLTELYEKHRVTAIQTDLNTLWRNLGVSVSPVHGISLKDSAPWAKWRTRLIRGH